MTARNAECDAAIQPSATNACRDLAAVRLAEEAERIVANWPPLTDEQVEGIVAIIRAGAS